VFGVQEGAKMKPLLSDKDQVVSVLESLLKSVRESQWATISKLNASRGVIEGEPDNGFKTFRPDPQVSIKLELDYYK
jgi:hypothetical protein